MNSARTLGSRGAVRVVLDTNTVLDLWVFRDVRVAALRSALDANLLDWVALAAMREELACVLARGVGERYGADAPAVLALWDRHARLMDAAAGLPRLRCRDTDDQKFLDLALDSEAQWLLTSDRDLLSLKRRAGALGLVIAPPHHWAPVGLAPMQQGPPLQG